MESEIDIKDENPFSHSEPTLKFDASDNSDIEVLAVCKSTAPPRNKLLRPIYSRKRAKTSADSANNGTLNSNKLLIKEEIIISDGSDVETDDKCTQGVDSKIKTQAQKLGQDESLSAIILNCSRCNVTRKVFSITLKSNCNECNVSMHYVCNKCNYKYDSMPALYRHKKLQCQFTTSKKNKPRLTSMAIMKCNNCDQVKKMFFTQRNPPLCSPCHIRMCYQCIVCSRPYTSYSGIYTHVRRYCQLRRRVFYCNDCPYSCTKPSTLIRHLKLSHSKQLKTRNTVCSKCNVTFADLKQLRAHKLICSLSRYQCKFCNYRPKVISKLQKHLLTHHPQNIETEGLENAMTSVAEKKKIKGDALLSIVRKDGDLKLLELNSIKKLYCPKCKRTNDYVGNLCACSTCKTSYLYQCSRCQKNFVTSVSLHRHVRRTHAEPKFNCENCGRGFACLGDMNVHKKICGQKLKYECSICEFKTRYKNSLGSHMYKLHNDNRKAFRCDVCGVVYKTNRAIKRHLKIGCSTIE